MFSYQRDMLKFMMSAIGKTSGNIAYNRKLLKILVKTLKNTFYGINFAKIAGKKNSAVLLKYEPFTVVSQRLINLDNKTLFFQSPCPGSRDLGLRFRLCPSAYQPGE